MKKILLLSTAFALSIASFAQPSQTQPAQPKAEDVLKVNVEKHDFGKIVQGTPVTYTFEVKNISDKPIVVENTYGSCGCTTPDKITDPILPGKTVPLKVQYNAAAAAPFTKDVYIKLAGIDQPKSIQITGEVLTQEAYDAYKKSGNDKPAAIAIPVPVKTTEKTKQAATATALPAGRN